jgi:hypothetical protein
MVARLSKRAFSVGFTDSSTRIDFPVLNGLGFRGSRNRFYQAIPARISINLRTTMSPIVTATMRPVRAGQGML